MYSYLMYTVLKILIIMQLLTYLHQYKALRWATITSSVMLVMALIGLVVDDRMLLGEKIWLKPMKFGVSIIIFCITAAWLLSIMPYSDKVKKWLEGILGWTLVLEAPLLLIQVFRGVRSHFNAATPFDGMIFGGMGFLIYTNATILFFLFGTAFFKKLKTSLAMQRAIQFSGLAMIVSVAAAQMMLRSMAHSVGVPDGGAGMPVTHWSTEGGDWRAVHFLGMHAFQVLPLLVYFFKDKVTKRSLNIAVWVSGLLYIGIILFIFLQTSKGIPLVAL